VNHKNYSSEGFVIARKKFSEGDRILILFTKEFGKTPLIAKGVRKLTSKKRGGIEIFNKIKFSAAKSHGIDVLTEVEVLNSYESIRNDLRKTGLAYYFCEVIGRVTSDNEKHDNIYEILDSYFSKISISGHLKKLRLSFVKEVLINLGFWPINKEMTNPDAVLENIVERQMNSVRVGKKMLQHY